MPDLLASYFTIAGDHPPSLATGASPYSLRDRIEAAARAGYTGFGFYASDLSASLESLNWADIRALLAGNGIRHVEVECLRNWFADGELRNRRLSGGHRRTGLHRPVRLRGDLGRSARHDAR